MKWERIFDLDYNRILTIDKDEEVLRKQSKDITEKLYKKLDIKNSLIDLISIAWTGGVAIAAPQIGINLNYAIYSKDYYNKPKERKWVELINPEIIQGKKIGPSIEEGCLSIPGVRQTAYRYSEIVYETGWNKNRQTLEAKGFWAFVIQHEIDHLNGILYIDRNQKINRNDPCICNSGIKYKKCCDK